MRIFSGDESRVCTFILQRARALTWQAARHTPHRAPCAELCRAWIRRARSWAESRSGCIDPSPLFLDLIQALNQLDQSLDCGLPFLFIPNVNIYKQV